MIVYADVIFGLCWGDEGKGKISNAIADQYDMVCRWNGGPNAGHTVYINDKKYKTHIIPCGIFKNKPSIIGPNCVLNVDKFYQEIQYLKEGGFDTNLIKVSPRCHIITEDHIKYDLEMLKDKFGTTGQGIAPAYADKMLRKGKLARDLIDKEFLWDEILYGKVLCEGAQSFWLDINRGDYPFVTSSETLPYSACSLGINVHDIRKIIGVAKIYDTKSGIDPSFPNSLLEDQDLNKIIELGKEYGSTTGRKRIANWLNLNKLLKAINISNPSEVFINKCDILSELGIFKLIQDNNIIEFKTINEMQNYILNYFRYYCDKYCKIYFSGNKESI